ncbi:STAS/SEC14 domain-containing protein [uncultured Sphingomonas sp.]|uniref:STAS/SEC14 domain-containing protein n=1 Tax=uncultured Sphingomonas sp. TaxID=158754 RepID=UPI0026164907|nr:STAS/SEC14 domain-containing protein [uncultured Sphingomonas sp.]
MLAIEVADDGLVELVVDGAITRADFDNVVTVLEGAFARHGKVNVVEVVRKFGGITPHLWWQDVKWSFGHLDRFGRCAMVTDSGWIGPVARVMAAMLPIELKTFGMGEMDAARAWARGAA